MSKKALFVAFGLIAVPAAAQQLQPTKKDVQEAISAQGYVAYPEREYVVWRQDLRTALKSKSPDAAADILAAKFKLPKANMRRLVRAWIIAQSRQYDSDHQWVKGVRTELYALAPAFRGKPLGLAVLAEALDATTDDCSADDFNILLSGSADPAADAYVIANASTCTGNFARAAVAAGDRAVPALIRAAEYGGLPPRDVLPLYAWLTTSETLAHVREADRSAVAALLWQRYLTALFSADFNEHALALFDGLPTDLRAAVVSPKPRPKLAAIVDGIPMTFAAEGARGTESDIADGADALAVAAAMLDEKAPGPKVSPTPARKSEPRDLSALDAPIQQLAEAMAIAGREDEARRLLQTLPGLAEAKASAACEYESTGASKTPCPESRRLPMGALPLDLLLNTPSADPYPIAETTLSGSGNFGRSASNAIVCRVFSKENYPGLCTDESDDTYISESSTNADELSLAETAIEHVIPNFKALRVSTIGAHDTPVTTRGEKYSRKTVAAIAPDYREKPVPAEFSGSSTSPPLKGLAPLSEGFQLVRAERAGSRVVAISVSQTYDPTGEVSQGGYWVHVSEDGGKHWAPPLYTGLADRFPYVVLPASPLPLINGDTVQLAVDISEIDTASVSYPPVALRSRRRAEGRYITIPLADLRRDTNGDGIPDIAAHHLLLDRARSAGATPFIVGSDYDSDCRTAPSADKMALVELLGRIIGPSGAAVIEPVDRPAGQLIGAWRKTETAGDGPLFLIGQRQDFTCLTSKRMIVVYDKADIQAIEQFTPDFHALEMPRIVFNRSHDRGYVRWSTGWAGGTYRLRRINGKWNFDSISSWIT